MNGARRGDPAAREELVTYFTAFVHGALISQVAAHVANEQVKLMLDEAMRRINEPKDAQAFGPWLVEAARRRAQQLAKTPGSTLEMLGGGTLITEGKKCLSKVRQLPDPMRERLVFRLLEGITGPEIAEATGANPSEVRADLERGLAALVRELGGQQVNVAGDGYLWSLAGSPHAAVVPLENQLTPMRYDPSVPDQLMTEGIGVQSGAGEADITPVSGPRLEKPTGEGRRPTSPEQSVIVALDDSPSLPNGASSAEDEPSTTPGGQRLHELPDESTGVIDPMRPGAPERTRQATDLPAAAQENPFAQQPGTIPASDLPAAAHIERPSKSRRPAEETRPVHLLGEEGSLPPTEARPLPPAALLQQSTRKVDPPRTLEPTDSTDPRGIPVSQLAKGFEPDTGSLTPSGGQDWRTSVLDARTGAPAARQAPQGFSLTRGSTPFVMAVLFFAFFIAIAYVNIRGTERGVRRGWNLVPVTVASQNIPEGAVVDFEMISTRQVPDQFVTASVVKPDSAAYIVNQRIMVPVQAGDPLLWSQFETARSTERLSRRVNKRGRAYTLEAKSLVSVGGWVRPGDHVDLIITMRDEATKERTASTTLQNIMILATGKMTAATNFGALKPNQQEYSNVSVLVLPEEIEILALMREKASYRMVLRNDEDFDMIEAGKSTPDTLINGERVEVLRKKRFQTIQLIRNSPKPGGGDQPTQQPRR